VLQYEAIYNKWKYQTRTDTLTAAHINQLGRILCGASAMDISDISLDDYE